MKWIDRFDLFLLDFDGLLVNTERLHFEAYRAMCRKRGFELSWSFDHYCSLVHLDSQRLREALFEELPELKKKEPNWSILYPEKQSHYFTLLKEGNLELMPGVEAFLQALQRSGRKRCVVTNSTNSQVAEIRRYFPCLASIPVWITRENYENPKPAPDAYLKAKQLLADPGDRIIGFEDTLKGVKALQAAGIPPILICLKNHPQMQEEGVNRLTHFESLIMLSSSEVS